MGKSDKKKDTKKNKRKIKQNLGILKFCVFKYHAVHSMVKFIMMFLDLKLKIYTPINIYIKNKQVIDNDILEVKLSVSDFILPLGSWSKK